MTGPGRIGGAFLAGLALVAALPFLGLALRGPRGPACAVDGVSLEGAPVVRVEGGGGGDASFCCIGCAERWIRAGGGRPARVLVTDEKSGRLVEAGTAWFVRSGVVAQPATEDRVHAFGSRADAEAHAKAYFGRVLSGAERPFGGTK